MAEALCKLQVEIKGHKRRRITKRNSKTEISAKLDELVPSVGNFPNSTELYMLDEKTLQSRCNLGYRAKIIVELSRSIENGELKLKKLERPLEGSRSTCEKKIYDMLSKRRGFGPFTCSNVLMCIGYYQRIPTDTETCRHLKEVIINLIF